MSVAESYIGTKERPAGSNNVVFNTDYYGHAVSGADYPWCCAFVWDVFRMAGASDLFYGGNKTAYCPTYESWAKDAGLSVGKENGRYGDVATMDFGKGRASHIGFILYRNNDGTYQTIEGNTSITSEDNGGAVMVRTRSLSVIRYIFRPKYTEEEKVITVEQFMKSVANVAAMAKKGKWTYGDSHTLPPCADKKISCDRLVARALWDLGYTSQPTGGITVLNMERYLLSWKFTKVEKQSNLRRGDIVLLKQKGTTSPTASWHTFVLAEYNPATAICSSYDEGSQSRIEAGGYFENIPLIEWSGHAFYCGFRIPKDAKRLPTDGEGVVFETQLNKSYCLDISGGSVDPKANLQLWKKNKTLAQEFIMQDVKDGYVRLVNKKSGLVISTASDKAANKTNIVQAEWNGAKTQMWKLRMNADWSITIESALNEAYVIDVADAKSVNGTNIWLYKWNGTKAQKFYVRN